jgi:diguanylate cyclase (GGDEF)-like protein
MAHAVLQTSSSMPSDLGANPTPSRPPAPTDELQSIRALSIHVGGQLTLARAIEAVSSSLAAFLNAPIALLSRDPLSWRFETHAFPTTTPGDGAVTRLQQAERTKDPLKQLQEESGYAWTAIGLGALGDREWALLLPGQSGSWAERPGFEQLVENVGWSLGQVANRELADYANEFQRRLHAFNRRLTRESDPDHLNQLVLTTLARQVRAETGALALHVRGEDALAIVATAGYPLSLVEHLRIRPGEGLIGAAYKSGKAIVGDSDGGSKRLRYRSDSYMVLPIVAGQDRLGVIALTDRSDGRRFDARDFASARVMVSSAASAFSRQRLHAQLAALTELATVDPVSGLFNRRYLETRLEAEVERARRQGQDLALLLIDIDDFKRVNDTRGHLEGDRILRDVADLLRDGVRIFDVCARYGGEEFVIVMPAASAPVAQQVAERIRSRVERNFSNDAPPVTVSVGVGMLDNATTADELIDVADRAMIAAKKAGKNLVWTRDQHVRRLP